MNIDVLREGLDTYDTAFMHFTSAYQLSSEWFRSPDHFAIKCADELDYLATCTTIGEHINSDGLWELSLDDRLLASAELVGRVSLGGFSFGWIEIMQPKPGKEMSSGFVEHTEFFFPDSYEVMRVLEQRGVAAEVQENPSHSWVNVVIDDAGREIKFNNKPLARIAEVEREEGKLRRIV